MSNFMGAALTVDDIYPVGSIYMSVNAVDPANLFGGTWEHIKERFLLGAGDTHTPGSTGGEFEHVLTVEEIPPHTHPQTKVLSNGYRCAVVYENTEGTYDGDTRVENQNTWLTKKAAVETWETGGGWSHNNTPPLFGSVHLEKNCLKLEKAGWRHE